MNTSGLSTWFRGLKGRLLFAAILPLIGYAVLFSVSYLGIGKETQIINVAHESLIPNIDAIANMRNCRNRFGYQTLKVITDESADGRASHLKEAAGSIAEFESFYSAYTKAPFLPGEEAIHEKAKGDIANTISVMKEIVQVLQSDSPHRIEEAKALLDGKFTATASAVQKFTAELSKMYHDSAAQQAIEAKKAQTQVITWVILISSLASFLTLAILLIVAHRVSSSVGALAGKLSQSSAQVTTSVEQLNEAGNNLSQSSTEAAASLEETVASLEELTSMVKMNSDNARQAASLSTSSREAAEKGEKEIHSLIKSMTEISSSSKKIEEIISVIDDIAFQTNLLALNAAVEAARAGEQGKGFAVVAEAVRALAQRSASSAKDISSLIKDSVSKIERGGEIADSSGAVLSNIVSSIKKVSDLNSEIAAASSEQTTGIQQISKAMNQLDQASQSNAASAEEIAATSGEINSLAETTQNLSVDLNKVILGNSEASVPLEQKSRASQSKSIKASSVSKREASHIIPFEKGSVSSTTEGF